MLRTVRLLALVLLALAGCSSPFSVKIDGDVQGTDKLTPRGVKAQVYEGSDHVRAKFEEAKGHLSALTGAKVTIALKLKKEEKPRASQSVTVDSRTAKFHFEASGEDGPLTGVLVHVEAPGRQPVERTFPSPAEVPFEAVLLAVLDESGGPVEADKPPAEAPPAKTNGAK